MTVESSLKKFAELNGYTAQAWSKSSFIKHLAYKFELSEFELNKAIRQNKIRIIVK